MPRFHMLLAVLVAASGAAAHDLDCLTYGDLPAALGSCSLPPAAATATVTQLDATHLIIHVSEALEVYDVADPTQPVLVGSLGGLEHNTYRGLPAVVGHHAYLAQDPGLIVDLGDPGAPAVVGDLGGAYRSFAADGALLAASAALDAVTTLYDCTDPANPLALGTVLRAGAVALVDDTLAIMADGIWLYDIADPAAPALITFVQYETESGGSGPNSYYHTTRVLDVELLGDAIVVVTNNHHQYGSWIYGNVQIHNDIARRRIDISDPAAPAEDAFLAVRRTSDLASFVDYNLTRVGEWMIEGREVFDPWSADLATASVLPAGQPVPGGVVDLGGSLAAVCDHDNLAVVPLPASPVDNVAEPLAIAGSATGYANADVGDGFLAQLSSGEDEMGYGWVSLTLHEQPGQPAVVSRYWDGWTTRALACDGRTLVVGNMFFRVEPDLSLTEHPIDLPFDIILLDLADEDRLAVIPYGSELALYDLGDPGNPVLTGQATLPGGATSANDLLWLDDQVLVAASNGLLIFQVDGSGQPSLAGMLAMADVRWVATANGRDALIQAGDELISVDIRSPLAPIVTASRDAGIQAGPPLVQGNWAYSSMDGLLTLYDVSTLEPLGTVALDQALGRLDDWDGALIGAGRTFAGFAILPRACEIDVTGSPAPPLAATLIGAAPNPFNPRTTVSFSLTRDQEIDLAAYDLRGRRVRGLAHGAWPAGTHHVSWDGRDDGGNHMAAGVYLLRLEADGGVETGKAVLLK